MLPVTSFMPYSCRLTLNSKRFLSRGFRSCKTVSTTQKECFLPRQQRRTQVLLFQRPFRRRSSIRLLKVNRIAGRGLKVDVICSGNRQFPQAGKCFGPLSAVPHMRACYLTLHNNKVRLVKRQYTVLHRNKLLSEQQLLCVLTITKEFKDCMFCDKITFSAIA